MWDALLVATELEVQWIEKRGASFEQGWLTAAKAKLLDFSSVKLMWIWTNQSSKVQIRVGYPWGILKLRIDQHIRVSVLLVVKVLFDSREF